MKKLNVAIIGQGRSGRNIHGAFFKSEANKLFNVVAIVDLLHDRRERAKQEFECDVYASHTELYGRKDIDLVVNASYSHLHYHVTMDLLTHGFNVVVEKPFCEHVKEAKAMIRAAEENNVMLCVFQQSHFAPYYRRIRQIMDSGILGRIIQISIHFSGYGRRWDWQVSQRYCGGHLRNTGPHPLEQALDILDSDTLPAIYSRLDRVNSFGDAEDYAKVLMLTPGKPVIDIEISSSNAYSDFNYLIHGDRGTLKATLNHISYKYFKDEEAPKQRFTFDPICKEDGTPAYCRENLKWYEFEEDLTGTAFDTAVKSYYDNIYAHLTTGEQLVIQPKKIAQMVALFEEVHRQNPLSVRF